eukprot:105825-Rhodomonas_salina.1
MPRLWRRKAGGHANKHQQLGGATISTTSTTRRYWNPQLASEKLSNYPPMQYPNYATMAPAALITRWFRYAVCRLSRLRLIQQLVP